MLSKRSKFTQALLGGIVIAGLIAAPADARRGGSFGSRGSRTYYSPSATSLTPRTIGPMQRSMTQAPTGGIAAENPSRSQTYGGPTYTQPRPSGRFGGFAGGLLGGLVAGGLLGSLLGHGGGWGMGYGGMGGGFLISLIQLMLLGALVWFVIGRFRRNAGSSTDGSFSREATSSFGVRQYEAAPRNWTPGAPAVPMVEFAISESDKADFERLLSEVQDAFGREDYARLRELTTPEIMSFLSEELSQNATRGRRNEVRGTRLLDAEVSEAWSEGNADYATIAMHYESIDVIRDRASGAVVFGNPDRPTQATEVWTFVRFSGGPWKLSAIQE